MNGCTCTCHRPHLPQEAGRAMELYYELGDGCTFVAQERIANFYSPGSAERFKRSFPSWRVGYVVKGGEHG